MWTITFFAFVPEALLTRVSVDGERRSEFVSFDGDRSIF
jgi:hypothetical protein